MEQNIWTKPEIGDGNWAFDDVNHLEAVTRATVLVVQVLDKRRNDVATKITRLIRQANVPHPVEIATRRVKKRPDLQLSK